MRLKKFIKKAFTLVELVVVIAVVAILASVSVGLYFGITTAANKSVDEQVVTQYNKILELYEIKDGKEVYNDVEKIRHILEVNGMSNFRSFYDKNTFYWTPEDNRIVIWEDGEGVTYPAKLESKYSTVQSINEVSDWEELDGCLHGEVVKVKCSDSCKLPEHAEEHLDNDYFECKKCGKRRDLPMAQVNKDPVKNDISDLYTYTHDENQPDGLSYYDFSSLKENIYVTGLEARYTFSIAQGEKSSDYTEDTDWGHYIADYVVSFTKEGCTKDVPIISPYSAGLWGSYFGMNIAFATPDYIYSETEIPLLGIMEKTFKYIDIIDQVKQFICGAWRNTALADGIQMKVRLCLWEPNIAPENRTISNGNIVGVWKHSFTNGANNTSAAYETQFNPSSYTLA